MTNTRTTSQVEAPRERTAFDIAVQIAGSQRELARVLDVSPQAVSLWRKRGVIPVHHVKKLSAIYGIARSVLNPGVFG